ncbi:GNAT family N-acetyltransferase [Paenibacillus sp. SYP-B4298]|uniref:GNAT family N-acetyltransferase n=1 Tax=Paenibacillus sp. SYP-B4298 TaxID=2996034 RepID=UPI0022DD8499|nr:GNAT family N-acetyltransferase [Paenibacillus sp. SYP-B4298]
MKVSIFWISELWQELDHIESGYIHRFAVNRNYKGLGIGEQLIIWAEDFIRNNGKKK